MDVDVIQNLLEMFTKKNRFSSISRQLTLTIISARKSTLPKLSLISVWIRLLRQSFVEQLLIIVKFLSLQIGLNFMLRTENIEHCQIIECDEFLLRITTQWRAWRKNVRFTKTIDSCKIARVVKAETSRKTLRVWKKNLGRNRNGFRAKKKLFACWHRCTDLFTDILALAQITARRNKIAKTTN